MAFETMRGPVTTLHWTRKVGYIKGAFALPVCGIADKVDGWKATSNEEDIPRVNCEHCLHWLWEQEQPAKKLDLTAAQDRMVNMTFNNGMSARDFERAIFEGVKESFRDPDTEKRVRDMVSQAVAELYQLERFQSDVKRLHKEAEEEIDQEWQDNGLDDEIQADRLEEMRKVLRDVLDEARPDPAPQNIYMEIQDVSPKPLTPTDIMELGRAVNTLFPKTVTPNELRADYSLRKPSSAQKFGDLKEMWLAMLNESDFRVAFKQIMKEAMEEDAVETEQDQREWFMRVLNETMDQRAEELQRKAAQRWNEAWGYPKPQLIIGGDMNQQPKSMSVEDAGTLVGSDHEPQTFSTGLAYYEDPKRPWYKRIFNR